MLTLEEPVTEAEGLFLLCSDGISSSLHAELFCQLDAEGAVAAVLDSLGKDIRRCDGACRPALR